jgi:hypothetical protein
MWMMLGIVRREKERMVGPVEVEEVGRKVGLAEQRSFGGMMRINQVEWIGT